MMRKCPPLVMCIPKVGCPGTHSRSVLRELRDVTDDEMEQLERQGVTYSARTKI